MILRFPPYMGRTPPNKEHYLHFPTYWIIYWSVVSVLLIGIRSYEKYHSTGFTSMYEGYYDQLRSFRLQLLSLSEAEELGLQYRGSAWKTMTATY